jgi:hypothetical protein
MNWLTGLTNVELLIVMIADGKQRTKRQLTDASSAPKRFPFLASQTYGDDFSHCVGKMELVVLGGRWLYRWKIS